MRIGDIAVRKLLAGCALVFTVLLASCGGGGGESTPAAAPGGNWDALVWDQGNWQ